MRSAVDFDHYSSCTDFNSRISCEMRLLITCAILSIARFQFTHLMRDAISIFMQFWSWYKISIHASHARCDNLFSRLPRTLNQFQFTHLMRDAIGKPITWLRQNSISIHASHARCDLSLHPHYHNNMNFNSRISCEMRSLGHSTMSMY